MKALRFENNSKDMLTELKGRNRTQGWDSASREHAMDLSGIPLTHDERKLSTKNDSGHKMCMCVCMVGCTETYGDTTSSPYRGKQSSQDIFPGQKERVSATLVTPCDAIITFNSFQVWYFDIRHCLSSTLQLLNPSSWAPETKSD